MQGNCTGAGDPTFTIAGVPLVPRKPGQCVLLADNDLLTLGPGRLWVHNLYIRHKATQRDLSVSLMYTRSDMGGQLWMTGCTLQGTGSYDSTFGADGLWMHSQAYVEGTARRHGPMRSSDSYAHVFDALSSRHNDDCQLVLAHDQRTEGYQPEVCTQYTCVVT